MKLPSFRSLALAALATLFSGWGLGAFAETTGGTKLEARPEGAVDLTDDTDNRASIDGNDNLNNSKGATAFNNDHGLSGGTAPANGGRFGGNSLPVWTIYEFKDPTSVTAIGIKNQVDGWDHAARSLKKFSLQAADSTNATTWTDLLVVTDESSWGNGEWRYWSLENDTRYKAYKFNMQATQGNAYAMIQDLEFYGSTLPSVAIKGDPENLGDIDYSSTKVEVGTSVTKTAFDGTWTNSAKTVSATCTGYTLYTNDVEMASGSETSCTFTVPDVDVKLVWHFDKQVKVAVSAGANGSVSTVDGWYRIGDVVESKPTGASGYGFFDWTIADGSAAVAINDEKFIVKGPTTLTANFAPVTNLEPGTDVISVAVTNHLATSTDPVIFRLAAGTYKETHLTNCVDLTGAVHVIGAGAKREDVIVTRGASQSARIFRLAHSRALVKKLTMTGGYGVGNGQPSAGGAAAIYEAGGTIADCLVRNSGVWTYNSCGGGLYLLGGLVSRCVVSNCQTQVGYGAAGGSGIYASGSSVIENSLIIANKIGGTSNAGAAAGGVSLYGSAQLLNSTVVMNGSTSAYVGGVYFGSKTAKMVNTAVFGNVAAADKIATVKFATDTVGLPQNCASDDAAAINASCIATDAPAFTSAGEPNRDYTLTVASPLRNAGTTYLETAACSATDLAGNARVAQTDVDIGAYEFQSSGLTCAFTAEMPSGLTPAEATFTATAEGGSGALTYKWDFNGDGVFDLTTNVAVVTHTYERGGTHSVALEVSDGTATATTEHRNLLQTCQKDVYVATDGTAEAPYADWATATSNLNDAVAAAVDGCVIHVAAGDYTVKEQVSVTKALQILGENGEYADVSIEAKNGVRCFYIDNANALLANMTIHGDSAASGRSVQFANNGGAISNCWVKCVGGKNAAWGVNGSAIFGSKANIKRCVFSGDAQMNTGDSWNRGAVLSLSASTISDSIIRDTVNAYAVQKGNGGNVVSLLDHSTMLNCSIVNATNKIAGADVAALFLDSTSYATNSLIYDVRRPEDVAYVTVRNGTNNLYRCAMEDEVGTYTNCIRISAADFRDCAKGDYRPSSSGALVNAGATQAGQSVGVDLAGRRRVVGRAVDIGCYECQSQGLTLIVR